MRDMTLSLPSRAIWIAALFVAELIAIVVAFQVLTSVECRLTGIEAACRGLRGAVLCALCLGVMLGVYLWSRPRARHDFARIAGLARGWRDPWAMAHGVGLAAIFLPLLIWPAEALNSNFVQIFPVLIVGALIAAVGGVFWLARPRDWLDWLAGRKATLGVLLVIALVLPSLAEAIGPLWYWNNVTEVTFGAVAGLLGLFADAPVVIPEAHIIGANGFLVAVADSCSGVEGFALMGVFLALYAALFRRELHLTRFWMVVLPVAMVLSWVLNVVRITALILIGAYASPELAENGFHSFAGWMFFTLLVIGVLIAVNSIGWLQKDPRGGAAGSALREDPIVARIAPFILFMLSGVIAQAFWTAPELAYPYQAVVMAGALWWCRAPLLELLHRPSVISVLVGAVIGVFWIIAAPAPSGAQSALIELSKVGLVMWIAMRLLGTIVLVPIIEELFFRGYVQMRIDSGSPVMRIVAVVVSAGLFGLLHGRWLEAGLAGVLLSLVYLHRNRLADAIVAHGVANAMIAVVAAWRGDWALI